ncbi:MAG: hypothetical protein V1742_07565 [Pseudomonadota bacterium]
MQDIEVIWQTLEMTIAEMEKGDGDWENHVHTAQAAILLLFEYSPPEILGQILGSELPARPVAAWLVYEGAKMDLIPQAKLTALLDYWNAELGPERGSIQFQPRD